MISTSPHKILVMRFSAFGDVAMTLPVLKEVLDQNPHLEIYFLSRKKFQPLVEELPQIKFIKADLEGEHKGVWGLFKLYKEIKSHNFEAVADLHNVLRTKILRRFFAFHNIKMAFLDKGRAERKALIRKENKVRKPIQPMVERYADVFRELGYKVELSHQLISKVEKTEKAVGIAPFAMYEGKMYPIEKMRAVALKLAQNGTKVYLFGARNEAKELETWEKLNSNIKSIAGKLSLKEELNLIRNLSLMISMDSANMHLASLVGTKVVSIWGNTHPFMGFLGYGQSIEDVIQDESFQQRPTSVFGKESSRMEKIDFFQNISPEIIIDKVNLHLQNS
jgi:ADP-heptose:LPS heptosyltransferase